jgi:diaminopimelate epimerase
MKRSSVHDEVRRRRETNACGSGSVAELLGDAGTADGDLTARLRFL